MVKAIKPTIGKRDDIVENKHIEKSLLKQDEFKSINIMGNIDKVMNIWNEFINRTHRKRNITPYVKTKIPDKNWSLGYIRSLRSYGTRLKDAGVYDKAMEEDWDFATISDFFRRRKEQKENIQKIKAEESKIQIKTDIPHEETAEEYIRRTRPGIG